MGESDTPMHVCVAGITGWTGGPISEAIASAADLQLVAGASGPEAGRTAAGVPVFGAVGEALDAVPTDVLVLVDFTSAQAVEGNVVAAVERGVDVVSGSSALTAADYATIDALAKEHRVGVIALANASMMAALLQHFAVQAAAYLPSWEVIDYADAAKMDVPSGTSRQLAERLGEVRRPTGARPVDEVVGPRAVGRRHADPLGPAPRLRGVERDHLRRGWRAARPAPRGRGDGRSLRGWHPPGCARGRPPGRPDPRARCLAIPLTRGAG